MIPTAGCRPFHKPLILLTPKYLLHHRPATSALSDFATGTFFSRVIDDSKVGPSGVIGRPAAAASGCAQSRLLHVAQRHLLQICICLMHSSGTHQACSRRQAGQSLTASAGALLQFSDNTRHLAYHPRTGEPHLLPPEQIRRVILCSGQIYYQLSRMRRAKKIRLTLVLFPLPRHWQACE